MTKDGLLPPRPGEEDNRRQAVDGVIPLYVQGMAIPLTEREALAAIAQLSSALQAHGTGMRGPPGGVVYNA